MTSATLRNFGVRSFGILAIAAVLSLHPGTARADDTKVTIDNFTFTPATVTIAAGTTVTCGPGTQEVGTQCVASSGAGGTSHG